MAYLRILFFSGIFDKKDNWRSLNHKLKMVKIKKNQIYFLRIYDIGTLKLYEVNTGTL